MTAHHRRYRTASLIAGTPVSLAQVVPCWSSAIRTRAGHALVGGLTQGLEALGLLLRQPPRDGSHGPPGHRSHIRIHR